MRKVFPSLIPIFILVSSFLALWFLTDAQPLVHDEAVYLTKARSWIEGTPANEFRIYRPIGMAWVGWVFLQFGDSEQMLRIFGVIFGTVTLLFTYLLFRRITNMRIALSTVLVVGTSSLFLRRAPEFLNDIPAAGLLLGVLWLLWRHYETVGQSKSIYFAAPLAALAFYLRYGVSLSLGLIGVLSLIILLRKFASKEYANFSRLGITGAIFFLLMLPHFLQSFYVEGSFWGILQRSSAAAGREYLGEGLLNYIKWLPSTLAGPIAGASVILGFIVTCVILSRKSLRQKYEGLLWLGSIGLLSFFFTGLLIHAETRYVFFPIVLLSGVGVSGVYFLMRSKSKLMANLLIGLITLSAIYLGKAHYLEIDEFFEGRKVNAEHNSYVEASHAIRNDVAINGKCAVWTITFRPEISWYSRCNTFGVRNAETFKKDFLIHLRKDHYSAVFTQLKGEQVDLDNAEKYGVVLTEIYRSKKLSPQLGELVVYRIVKTFSENE